MITFLYSHYLAPVSSPLFLLGTLLFIWLIFNRIKMSAWRFIFFGIFIAILWGLYHLGIQNPNIEKWIVRLNSPIFAVIAIFVLPSIFLPRNKWYKAFLILPAVGICLVVAEVVHQYNQAPEGSGFSWFLMRSDYLIIGITGIMIIAQYYLSVRIFRKLVRIIMLLVLIYGGFAFRQNYTDYQEAVARRRDVTPSGIINITETVPVMKSDDQLNYLPAAPCRFSADGGYVQGCVMELLQRMTQINYVKIKQGDLVEISFLTIALGASLSLIILLYIGARWWCGWVCPLSTLGDIFNTIRRWIGLGYLKPIRSIKKTALVSGLSFASFGLVLAQAYAHINEDGTFLGCKIPVYPFCKICPGQMVCPVASQGIGALPPLPGMEWLFGFFKISVLLLLSFFIIGFISSRRIWCRFCPMGMVGGLFNRGSLVALKKDSRKCNQCGVCNEVCPMDIQQVQQEMIRSDVSSFDCVYCLKCVDHCPQDGCLHFEFAGEKILESRFERK